MAIFAFNALVILSTACCVLLNSSANGRLQLMLSSLDLGLELTRKKGIANKKKQLILP